MISAFFILILPRLTCFTYISLPFNFLKGSRRDAVSNQNSKAGLLHTLGELQRTQRNH